MQGIDNFVANSAYRGSGITLARKLKIAFQKLFPAFDDSIPDAVCTYLDLRYKSIYLSEEQQQVITNAMKSMLQVIQSTSWNQSTATANILADSDNSQSSTTREVTAASNSSVRASTTSSLWNDYDNLINTTARSANNSNNASNDSAMYLTEQLKL